MIESGKTKKSFINGSALLTIALISTFFGLIIFFISHRMLDGIFVSSCIAFFGVVGLLSGHFYKR